MFARVGEPHCPEHGIRLEAQSVAQIVDQIMAIPEGTGIMLLAPVVKNARENTCIYLPNFAVRGLSARELTAL